MPSTAHYGFGEVTTLGWSKDPTAKELISRAAQYAAKIMRRRQWYVPLLAEFYPAQPNLYGLNTKEGPAGDEMQSVKIELRLRSSANKDDFLAFEDIVLTLMHELAHIVFGTHDEKFRALNDELVNEYQKIRVDHITEEVESFPGRGRKTGRANQSALSAAFGALVPSRFRGGQSVVADRRKIEAAVERRMDEAVRRARAVPRACVTHTTLRKRSPPPPQLIPDDFEGPPERYIVPLTTPTSIVNIWLSHAIYRFKSRGAATKLATFALFAAAVALWLLEVKSKERRQSSGALRWTFAGMSLLMLLHAAGGVFERAPRFRGVGRRLGGEDRGEEGRHRLPVVTPPPRRSYHSPGSPAADVRRLMEEEAAEQQAGMMMPAAAPDQWVCRHCTFYNHILMRECEICSLPRGE